MDAVVGLEVERAVDGGDELSADVDGAGWPGVDVGDERGA
jgi:hypothetical protein